MADLSVLTLSSAQPTVLLHGTDYIADKANFGHHIAHIEPVQSSIDDILAQKTLLWPYDKGRIYCL